MSESHKFEVKMPAGKFANVDPNQISIQVNDDLKQYRRDLRELSKLLTQQLMGNLTVNEVCLALPSLMERAAQINSADGLTRREIVIRVVNTHVQEHGARLPESDLALMIAFAEKCLPAVLDGIAASVGLVLNRSSAQKCFAICGALV